ncbi:MAG: proprotein convertase P, partial [Betaproteobacteria bacterium]|nr:proprotein convertase P [Betaproteobacteria bacterium]
MARYQGSPAAVVVDLSAGTAQDGWGGIDVLLNMEDIRGSSYDDLLVGNSQNNEIDGREGADTLRGLAGDDTLIGRAGADYLDGGDGHDSASYRSAPSAIFADLSTGTVQDGTGSTDSLINIEWISGSPFADTMIGSARSEGFAGNDGADTIDGGGGDDEVYYSGSDTVTTGVIVKLSGWAGSLGTLPSGYTGSALDQWGNVDVFRNIIGVEGSNYNDLIIGDSANNTLDGRGGSDTIDGGLGFDTVEYNQATGNIVVDLTQGKALDDGQGVGTASPGAAIEQDILISIENVIGGSGNDSITGDAMANELSGEAGDDTLSGEAGDDTLTGGDG